MVAFPPRQHPDTYSVSNVLEKLEKARQALETSAPGVK